MATRYLLATNATEYRLRFMEEPAALDRRKVSMCAATNVARRYSPGGRAAARREHVQAAGPTRCSINQRMLAQRVRNDRHSPSRRAPKTQNYWSGHKT